MTGMTRYLSKLYALALMLVIGVAAAMAQNPKRPTTNQPTQKKDTIQKQDQDRDRDFDRDKDMDRDRDKDRDQDRDRLNRPMTAQEREVMENKILQSRDHFLAAGYRQNMLNFALNLRLRLEQGESIDRNLARGAVKEIKRNFQEMEKRHKNQKKEMGYQMRERMSYMIQETEERQERMRNTIRTLENDAAASSPNSKQMLMHVLELEEQIRAMEESRQRKNVGGSVSMTAGTTYLDLAIF